MQLHWSQMFSEPGSHHIIEGYMQMTRATPPEVTRNFVTSEADDPGLDLLPLLPTLRVPTLVLHGDDDHIIPVEAGRYLADHIPGAQLYIFKGRGHMPIFTATVELAQVIRDFVQTGQVT